ncbi:hypothetical protein [Pseudodonghicola flavimaris]|uniref:Uncharacterized protein n=1 Tax=Pseudodonghicola flavimaris TaxID=3050036 RepID=A0ABT7EW76_9RHOB|nr:hypothetical protein [Pseudodonghicola flavimaris]MDK3016544.1 hypothetical protein [Pseudodonghicola flavimaris]
MLYGDLSGFRAYASARGNDAPAAAGDADVLAALQRASDYIRFFYVLGFISTVPDDTVTEATYEAAQIELGKPGFFSKTYSPGEAKVLVEVKGIRWERIGGGSGTAGEAMTPTSTIIEAMLGRYVGRGTGLGLRVIG